MRAIYINPHDKTVTEVDVRTEDGDAAYEALRELVFGGGKKGLLEAYDVGAGHVLYIDEEGLLVNWDTQRFFQLGKPPTCATFAGRGVLLRSTDEGGNTDCLLPLSLVLATTLWLDAREVDVPAPTITTFDGDGKATTVPLGPRDRWNYDNQPS